jgi:RND family efflux transporter MFP subunit
MAAAGVVLLAFGGGWLTWSLYRGTAAHYVTQKIERGSVVRIVTASGIVSPTATTPLLARVSGLIQALYCGANMKVQAGQLCAKIDPRPYQILVVQAKADLVSAEARLEKDRVNLAQTQTTFRRHEALAKRRAISRKALDKWRKTHELAQMQTTLDEARIPLLQAAFHAAEINLGSTNIVSPIDGTIVSRNVELGQTVAAGSGTPPLFLVAADLTVIHIDVNAGEKVIGEVKPGDKATFTVE